MSFKYQARNEADWSKRASSTTFITAFKDEYKNIALKKDNWVRFLPPTWDKARHFGYDLWVHYGIGPDRGCVVCLLKMLGKPCPICEAHAKAEAQGLETAKELRPVRRVLTWVIDRNNESQGPLLWAMPWTADRDLAKICKDRMTGEYYLIDHPEAGYDVTFDREGEVPMVKYVGWQISRRPSSVDEKHLEYITKHPLPDVINWRTYEEVAALFEGQPILTTKAETVEETARVEIRRFDPEPIKRPEPVQHEPETADERLETEQSYCSKTLKFRGSLLGCTEYEGHEGECNFERELDAAPELPKAVPTTTTSYAPPQQQQATNLTSRAAALKSRFQTGQK